MRKNEYVKLYQEVAKEKGLELTQKDVDVILESLEELVVKIFESGDNANIGGFLKVDRKEVKEAERECKIPGKECTYTIPASTKPTVKFAKSFVDKHTILK